MLSNGDINPWISGLQIATRILTIILAATIVATAFIALFYRGRIEKLMDRPYPQPWKYRWILGVIGALLLFIFPFAVEPRFGIHLSVGQQLLMGFAGASFFLIFMTLMSRGAQKVQTWSRQSRLRFAYVCFAFAAICAAILVYLEFFRP
jgi:hypothetical protein